ncbi:MAG: DUF5690 family protein [Lacibacter sp.]
MNLAAEQYKGKLFPKNIETTLFAALITFLSYTVVYAYRKPFTIASYYEIVYYGIQYQTWLIICQGVGYMLSKFYGIRFISELKRFGRWKTSLTLVGVSWLSLFFFAVVPPLTGLFFLVINGFCLGFMWGVVFSYAEGRRTTDFIGSVMAVSFIFAGGFTRSVGKWLLVEWNVAEKWMPFLTGLLFIVPFTFLIFLLERIPSPDADDVANRTERISMSNDDRRVIFRFFGKGLFLVTVVYIFLTVIRDLRDNFMTQIWSELGYTNDYSIYTKTETIITITVLVLISFVVLIRRNIQAFRLIHFLIFLGFLLTGISSLLFMTDFIPGAIWMQFTGMGLYMAYIPFNCIFFERMIGAFHVKGNAGFLMYVADAFGYLGSMLVMISKELFHFTNGWVSFYSSASLWCAVMGAGGMLFSLFYFNRRYYSIRSNQNYE